MQRVMLSGKIHRATVTDANLHYVGSITIDKNLMMASDIREGEQVHVVDISNGARLVTYAIAGIAGSGTIGMNGAAAHLIHVGDVVIIMSYVSVTSDDLDTHMPNVVHVDSHNRIVSLGTDPKEAVPNRPFAAGSASGFQ